ncbi:TROVE domain-containing protein [Micromonospora chalcea]|uniref:TROVE domain-containing protein n=1 Tax=Micromonospora chalcea TaxID=1874 RepID=UPI003D761764
MAKFNIVDNRRFGLAGPIATVSATPDTRTHLGAPAFTRDVKSDLFLLGLTNVVGEETYHERAKARDGRFASLVRDVALFDAPWLTDFTRWLRTEGFMRSSPLVAAADAVKARLDSGLHGGNRQLIDAALHRADEPGELIAYWRSRYGRAIPKPVKRGVADAVRRLYNERSALKYDTDTRAYRFGDVIEIVHPKPKARWQSALFEHALARRRNRAELFRQDPLPTLLRRRELADMPAAERRAWLEDVARSGRAPERLKAAGMTWEALSGWLNGPMDATAWEALIPSMGLMALARNLRNFDEAGVSDAVAAQVAARFADPDEVARSRMFPYRWLAAYENAPSLRWGHALDQALRASLAALPELEGRSLVLVDTSASMQDPMSSKSKMNRVRAAAVFGVALAARNGRADLHGFASGVFHHPLRTGGSVIEEVTRFCRRVGEVGHGTEIAGSLRRAYAGHDRVFIFSDMQTMDSGVTSAVPQRVKLYGFNLGGYAPAAFDAGTRNRVELGGLSDATFRLIPLLERGTGAGWPWQQ